MQIEQRLGRIHRIGQEHDVLLTNLVARGTVEEQILRVLQSKINLFELVVGELDMILGRIEDDLDFEALVFEQHIASRDDAELAARLEEVGSRLAQAREAYLDTRGRVDVAIYPRADHTFSIPEDRRDFVDRIGRWLSEAFPLVEPIVERVRTSEIPPPMSGVRMTDDAASEEKPAHPHIRLVS